MTAERGGGDAGVGAGRMAERERGAAAAGEEAAVGKESGTSAGRDRTGFSPELTMERIRQMQAQFTDERDWDQFHQPRNLLLALVGEVGELAELFQWRGEVMEGLPDWTDTERTAVAHELSDVLLYLVELSDKCGIDLSRAILEKLQLNRSKYPAERVRGSAKKYTQYRQ
ncbi:glutamyl-tRNA(Gln) amidotransferase subunit B, mitochondrial [Rhinoraja longicauda]